MTRNHHLANLIKYRDQPDRPDLSAPQSLQLYLRFDQLIIAAEFELWQLSRSSLLAELVGYSHYLKHKAQCFDLAFCIVTIQFSVVSTIKPYFWFIVSLLILTVYSF
ncbi:unnamed protein product [Trifolium pratense]|uniref:Uncharacterized protein n=1 Tax=Trifolium pratense TaxID=57577 RepID=A0ACB0JPI3_TRIPR|nr:unnamed protein product [Trifolium pratense]